MDAAAHTTYGHTTPAPVRGCVSLCHEDAPVPGPLCVLAHFDRQHSAGAALQRPPAWLATRGPA